MKQAILITGYKNVDQFLEIISFFGSDFNFYIHIDRKSHLDTTSLSKLGNVFVSCQYSVHWGGVKHLYAILLLAAEALKNKDNDFFHLITAEDYPVKSVEHFKRLDLTRNYIDFFELPSKYWGWDKNGGMDRFDYYNLYDFFNAKKRKRAKIIEFLIGVQKKWGLKRGYYEGFPKLYGGSTYWSLNRDALSCVIGFTNDNRRFLRRLHHTFCAEEMYFQTILVNSEHSSSLAGNNLRYVNWKGSKGGSPAFLDEKDFQEVISSSALFARKLDFVNGKGLKLLITNYFTEQAAPKSTKPST